MDLKILTTLGPSSMSEGMVSALTKEDVYLFRINLSHTPVDEVETVIKKIQSWTDTPICLDSEGAQVRNHSMKADSVVYAEGDTVKIHQEKIIGDHKNISFSPLNVSKHFNVGDRIYLDFDSVSFTVTEKNDDCCFAVVDHGGCVGSNKAANIDRDIPLEVITPKDKEAITIGLDMGVKNFSLSFANSADDVHAMRKLIGQQSNLISKIESIKGVLGLDEILSCSDQILIDRGDLSREVAIEKIPFLQRRIVTRAKSKGVPVFVATNLLESMTKTKVPTRAEVNDVVSTLLMGADGLVLAAETAVGKYPLEAVKMIRSLIKQYNRWTPDSLFEDIIFD
jgi:pyruvate kinase